MIKSEENDNGMAKDMGVINQGRKRQEGKTAKKQHKILK